MIAARDCQHVRNQFGRYGGAAFVLLVLPLIRETRNDCCDAARRGDLTSGDEDEKLHEVVVDIESTGLDDEDVFVSNGPPNLHVGFAVAEFLYGRGYGLYAKSIQTSSVEKTEI